METTRTRAFALTLNNYSQADIEQLKSNGNSTQVKYLIFGKEVGDKEQTPHLQAYIYFHNAKTFGQVKKFLGERYHIEKAKGTAFQNRAYCSKDNEFTEIGEIPKQGERSDIKHIKEQVSKGATMNEIIQEATSYQSLRTAELLMKYQKPTPREKPTVKWYYGPTGTGKTRKAWDELGFDDTWISGRNLKWWEGYSGQKNIIIDDFRGDFCTFHELLRILDRYPYRIEVKGSSQWLKATNIIITSAYKPEDVYETREDIGQLLRRLDCVLPFFDTNTNTEVAGNTKRRLHLTKNELENDN